MDRKNDAGNTWLIASCAILGHALGACDDGDGRQHYDAVGQHVGFVLESDEREFCAGTVPHLDRFIERMFEFLEEDTPDDFVAPVWLVEEAPCDSDACYHPTRKIVYVEASLDPDPVRPGNTLRHEVAHAVTDRAWGLSVPFFTEGLAEALTHSQHWSTVPELYFPVEPMLDEPASSLDYFNAAKFTRFLIDTRGIARFKQVFQAAKGHTGAEIQGLMADIYSESFAAIQSEFLSGEPRCQYQVDLCDPEAAESFTSIWYDKIAASCSDPDFYGSRGPDDQRTATQRTIAIEEAGTYRILTSFAWPPLSPERPNANITFLRCGDCYEQSVTFFGDQSLKDLTLDPGLYTFEVLMPFDTVVNLEVRRLPDAP